MSKLGKSYNIPTYDNDCECLNICRKLAGTYKKCYKGANMLLGERCPIEARQNLLQKERQKPGAFSRFITIAERVTLWLIAVAGLVLSVYALFK